MTTGVSVDLVQRMTFASTDAEEITDHIRQVYAGNRLDFGMVRGPTGYQAAHADGGHIAADRVRCSIDHRGVIDPWTSFCAVVLDQGTMRMTSRVSDDSFTAGDVFVHPLDTPIQFELSDVEARVVRMPMHALRQAAGALGVRCGQLRLEGTRPVSPDMAQYWREVVRVVDGYLWGSAVRSSLLLEELSRMTALAALQVFPNTTMSQHHLRGPGRVAPGTVRRALAYIEENAHLPLSLNDIAQAAGTGPRALQYAFRQHLDTTPLAHLRRERLDRAHRELEAAKPLRGETVTAIATKWGFSKPGHFAAAHRTAYGELPSETFGRG